SISILRVFHSRKSIPSDIRNSDKLLVQKVGDDVRYILVHVNRQTILVFVREEVAAVEGFRQRECFFATRDVTGRIVPNAHGIELHKAGIAIGVVVPSVPVWRGIRIWKESV